MKNLSQIMMKKMMSLRARRKRVRVKMNKKCGKIFSYYLVQETATSYSTDYRMV